MQMFSVQPEIFLIHQRIFSFSGSKQLSKQNITVIMQIWIKKIAKNAKKKRKYSSFFVSRCSRKLVQRLSCVANPNLKKGNNAWKKMQKMGKFQHLSTSKWVKKLYGVVLELQP